MPPNRAGVLGRCGQRLETNNKHTHRSVIRWLTTCKVDEEEREDRRENLATSGAF